jgi:hypothetical protein
MDTETQRELFAAAVDALGGTRSTARAMDVTTRTIDRLIAGTSRLHAGFLEDISKALIAHADHCRLLERQLSPAFATNRTEAQAKPPKHDGNASKRAARAAAVDEAASRLGIGTKD